MRSQIKALYNQAHKHTKCSHQIIQVHLPNKHIWMPWDRNMHRRFKHKVATQNHSYFIQCNILFYLGNFPHLLIIGYTMIIYHICYKAYNLYIKVWLNCNTLQNVEKCRKGLRRRGVVHACECESWSANENWQLVKFRMILNSRWRAEPFFITLFIIVIHHYLVI